MLDKLKRAKNLTEDEYGIFIDPKSCPNVKDVILLKEPKLRGFGTSNNHRKMYKAVCSVVEQYPSGLLLQEVNNKSKRIFVSIADFRTGQMTWEKLNDNEIEHLLINA